MRLISILSIAIAGLLLIALIGGCAKETPPPSFGITPEVDNQITTPPAGESPADPQVTGEIAGVIVDESDLDVGEVI